MFSSASNAFHLTGDLLARKYFDRVGSRSSDSSMFVSVVLVLLIDMDDGVLLHLLCWFSLLPNVIWIALFVFLGGV